MKYIHVKCGGYIDLKAKKCTHCGRKWNGLSFWLDPSGIRSRREPSDLKVRTKQQELTTVQKLIRERIPGGSYVVVFANLLPKWPRWARVLTTVGILGGLIYLIIWLIVLR